MPKHQTATHIRFVDSFVRNRHLAAMLLAFAPAVALALWAGQTADVSGLSRTQLYLILGGLLLVLIAAAHLVERWRRRDYGLYILPDALELLYMRHHRLDLQLNFHGRPVVVIRKLGRRYELTSVNQRKALYVPVAAIPSLPQILVHYDLDVKLVESA